MAYVFAKGSGTAFCTGNATGSVAAGGRVVLTDAVPLVIPRQLQYKFGRCKDGRRKILCFTTEW